MSENAKYSSGSLVYHKNKDEKQNSHKGLIDQSWEIYDPTPNIQTLFVQFDQHFFWKALGSVTVEWSKRMTRCAGVCSFQGSSGMCKITLSEPLLKFRPRKDLVETLLHEMIHAYLFVTGNNDDRSGHGPEFHKHMYRINKIAGTNITVYHDFHDEVDLYLQHIWRCDGPCKDRRPYFGCVKRAMNRAPGPNDRWWAHHQATCGGKFIKIQEPNTVKKKTVQVKKTDAGNIRKYFPTKNDNKPSTSLIPNNVERKTDQLNSATDYYAVVRNHWLNKFNNTGQIKRKSDDTVADSNPPKKLIPTKPTVMQDNLCDCPVCLEKVPEVELNSHLDECLAMKHTKPCIICSKPIPLSELEYHVNLCLNDCHESTSNETESEDAFWECTQCHMILEHSLKNAHLKECVNELKDLENLYKPSTSISSDACAEYVTCLVCSKQVTKSSLNAHLEECMFHVFDDDNNIEYEDSGIEQDDTDYDDNKENVYVCPICYKDVANADMNSHIDKCLQMS